MNRKNQQQTANAAHPSGIAELSAAELAEWLEWREQDDRAARMWLAYGCDELAGAGKAA